MLTVMSSVGASQEQILSMKLSGVDILRPGQHGRVIGYGGGMVAQQ